MTPDTYDHSTYTSGRMYQVSYDVAASRHVCHLIHTTTTLRSFRRTHADAALVAHLWVHSGQQHCQKHNAVQGRRCIPSCSRHTPFIRTAIRPHTYDDAHPTFALVERYSFIYPMQSHPLSTFANDDKTKRTFVLFLPL